MCRSTHRTQILRDRRRTVEGRNISAPEKPAEAGKEKPVRIPACQVGRGGVRGHPLRLQQGHAEHDRSTAPSRLDQSSSRKLCIRGRNRVTVHRQVLGEITDRRERNARTQIAPIHLSADRFRDLRCSGSRDPFEHSHRPRMPYVLGHTKQGQLCGEGAPDKSTPSRRSIVGSRQCQSNLYVIGHCC